MNSDRSFKICSDDIDSASLSSNHKRTAFANRLPPLLSQQHRNVSLDSQSNNIPEVDDQFASNENAVSGEHSVDMTAFKDCSSEQQSPPNKSSLNVHSPLLAPATCNESAKSTTANNIDAPNFQPSKNMSKAAVLRHLFFSQINPSASNTSGCDANDSATSTSGDSKALSSPSTMPANAMSSQKTELEKISK